MHKHEPPEEPLTPDGVQLVTIDAYFKDGTHRTLSIREAKGIFMMETRDREGLALDFSIFGIQTLPGNPEGIQYILDTHKED